MKCFNFDYFDGYIIPEIDGVKVLVDTGCPITVSAGSSLPSLGDIWMTPATELLNPQLMAGFSTEELEFEVLLGRNYLGIAPFMVDWDERTICFESYDEPEGDQINFKVVMAGASTEAKVNDKDVKLIIDTGAKISFLGHERFSESPVVGEVKDYHLSSGHFTAPLISAQFSHGSISINLTAGRLDNELFDQLKMVSIDGILGNDIYDYYSKVWYDFPGERMILMNRRPTPLSNERVSETVRFNLD
jgi:hypothetical protein